ncbi:VWA domain-containing protein [Virgibacillus ihumii]|uniref:VWA domain-containing protein n=1 Tax=Virgibacillus ihumii TaxID=2686091 RepID=UPI00157D5332|nr:VWA domain-containing protein [Virgibacillus ihumii]
MQQVLKVLILFLTLLIFIVGCSDNEEDKNPKNVSDQQEKETTKQDKNENIESNSDNDNKPSLDVSGRNIPDAPEKTAGLINQKKGPYATADLFNKKIEKEIINKMEKIGKLPKQATDKQMETYFSYIYSLVSVDFPNPEDVIKKWQFASFGNPKLPDARYHFKENYNIEIILDASGSMAALAQNGKTRMQLAKETINSFLSSVPQEANVSLRVYGHKGSGSEADKKMSCSAIEQIYGFAPYEKQTFQKALNGFKPSGWTPIAAALKQSQKTMKKFDSKKNTNLIYLVSDGIGTCDGDPVKVAKSFSKSNAKPIINIIGFQTDSKAQKQLEKMAEASDGIFTSVSNQEGLKEEFSRAEEVLRAWKDWKEQALNDAEYQKVEHSFDILGLTNEWGYKTDVLTTQLYTIITMLNEKGYITNEQEEKFLERRNTIEEMARQSRNELEEQLKKISADNVKKMKEKIKKKYDTQTQK